MKQKKKQQEKTETVQKGDGSPGRPGRHVLIIILALVVIGLGIWFTSGKQSAKQQPFTDFGSGIAEVRKLDFRYGTSYHEEMLNGSTVPLEKIDPMLAELDKLSAQANASLSGDDAASFDNFVKARQEMLESERYYTMTFAYGSPGNIWDGFACKDIGPLLNVSRLLNKTLEHGWHATILLDAALRPASTRTLIGADENKPQFYYSPFIHFVKTIHSINKSIDVYCYGVPMNGNDANQVATQVPDSQGRIRVEETVRK